MKNEFKRIDKDITEIVSDIPIDNIKDIYYKRYSDALKTLWINQDEDSFNKKMDELFNLMQRMSYDQRRACIGQDVKAYHDICYDLRIWLRSEAIFGLSTIFAYNWLIGSIKDDLETYKGTGDQYWLDSAYKLINQILDPFYKEYANDEVLNQMQEYLARMEDAPELSESDHERLDILKDWIRICGLYADLKDAKKTEKE